MAFGDIAKLFASLDLDTRPFEKGSRRVGGDLSKMEGGFGRVSTRAIALGSAVGVGIERIAEKGISVLFGALRAGEEGLNRLNDVQAQTAAVVQSTGGKAGVTAKQVRDLAQSIEDVTTADDKAVQSGENLLLTFTGIGKDIFPQASKAVVDLGIAMAQGDVANADFKASAIQIGKALNDPIKGITALRRVGVSFSKQQEDQIKGWAAWGSAIDVASQLGLKLNAEQQKLIKTNDGLVAPLVLLKKAGIDLTAAQEKQIKKTAQQNGLQKAQKAILAELTTEFGKAGEAAGKSGAAGVRRLNDAVEDTQISLAEGLAPALEDIRTEIATTLKDPKTQQAVRDLGKFLGEAARSGLEFAKGIPWQQVGDGLKTAAGFAGKLIDVFTHLPAGVQATIIGLAALNKLGGGGVIKIGVDLFKEGAKGILGQFVSRGSPANPMFVVAEGAGLGGAGGVAGAAKGGLGVAGKLFLVGEAIGLIAAVNEVRDNIAGELTQQTKGIHDAVSEQINNQSTTSGQLAQSLAGVEQGIEKLSHDPIGNALLGDQLSELERMRTELGSALVKLDDQNKANFRQSERDDASNTAVTKQAIDRSRDATEAARIAVASRVAATTTKVGDLVRAESGQTSRIVSAIRSSRPIVNLKVNVAHGDTIRVTKNYQSGGNIGRTGGQQEFG